MNKIEQCFIFKILMFLFVSCILGCATMPKEGHRFYQSSPKPATEIALVFSMSTVHIKTVQLKGENESRLVSYFGAMHELELLPDEYVLGMTYSSVNTFSHSQRHGSYTELKINIQKDNIYFIYPEFIVEKNMPLYLQNTLNLTVTWHPVVRKINEYSKEECKKGYGGNCPDREDIMQMAKKYLQSERLVKSYYPFEKPINDEGRIYFGYWR
jgi:hypothetical protein